MEKSLSVRACQLFACQLLVHKESLIWTFKSFLENTVLWLFILQIARNTPTNVLKMDSTADLFVVVSAFPKMIFLKELWTRILVYVVLSTGIMEKWLLSCYKGFWCFQGGIKGEHLG